MFKILLLCLLATFAFCGPASPGFSGNSGVIQTSPNSASMISSREAISRDFSAMSVRLPQALILPVNQQGPTNSPVCKAVWSKDGTICNPSKVLQVAQVQNNPAEFSTVSMIATKQAFTQSVNTFKVVVPTIIALSSLSKSVLAPKTPSPPIPRLLAGYSMPVGQVTATPVATVSLNLANIGNVHTIKYDARVFEKLLAFNMDTFVSEMDSCWKYLSHARNIAMCYACSQHNSQYFFNGKAIVSPQDCSTMLSKCLNFFSSITVLVTEAHYALVEFQKVSNVQPARVLSRALSNWKPITKTGTGSSSGSSSKSGSNSQGSSVGFSLQFGNLFSQEQQSILINLYKAMNDANLPNQITCYNTQSGTQKVTCQNSLCLRLFRLYKTPIFDEVGKLVDTIKRDLDLAVKSTEKVTSQKRILQADMFNDNNGNNGGSSNSDLFGGDIAILFTDANGQNMVQSSDTLVTPGGTNHQPMNFTHQFC